MGRGLDNWGALVLVRARAFRLIGRKSGALWGWSTTLRDRERYWNGQRPLWDDRAWPGEPFGDWPESIRHLGPNSENGQLEEPKLDADTMGIYSRIRREPFSQPKTGILLGKTMRSEGTLQSGSSFGDYDPDPGYLNAVRAVQLCEVAINMETLKARMILVAPDDLEILNVP